jgi:hypothetical protein
MLLDLLQALDSLTVPSLINQSCPASSYGLGGHEYHAEEQSCDAIWQLCVFTHQLHHRTVLFMASSPEPPALLGLRRNFGEQLQELFIESRVQI